MSGEGRGGGRGEGGRGGFGRGGGRDGGRGRGGRGRGRGGRGGGGREEEVWVPVTKLGRLVKEGKIASIEEIFLFSLPVKGKSVLDGCSLIFCVCAEAFISNSLLVASCGFV